MSRVLITGGTGSLGHALTDYYLKNTNDEVIILSRDELKQAQMREEFPDGRVSFFLGDVRDPSRLELAFEAHISVVIHAAALKRVDSVCNDPDEVFKTNVLGSRNVLHAARGRVPKCLLISSDKACYPTNAYGLSKGMAEHMFTAFNVYGSPQGTSSSVVRYGNVLGSRGSVVTVWRKQVESGLPLTLTHPGMTRFLLTLPQAVQMIQIALLQMGGGETFVPRLPACRMIDLAHAVGGEPPYPTRITGLRPGGEKMAETLLTDEECEMAVEYGALDPLEGSVDSLGFAIVRSIQPRGEDLGREGIGRYGWRSDRAPQLSVAQLKEIVDGL